MKIKASAPTALALALIAGSSFARGDDTFTKTITWTAVKPAADAKGKFVAGPISASSSHAAGNGFAACSLPAGPAELAAVTSEWNLITGLPAVPTLQTGLQDCQGGVAEAYIKCTVGKWTAIAGDPYGRGTLTTALEGKAYAKVFHEPPDTQTAAAKSKGKVTVEGFKGMYTTPPDRQGKVQKKVITLPQSITGETKDNKATSWKDPVVLEIYDDAGVLVASDTLMTLGADIVGGASLRIDNAEIVLKCPADGYSRVALERRNPGLWVTASTGDLSFGLADGVFTASPAVVGLPWVFTFAGGDVVEARLAAAMLPSFECDYEIPAQLLQPGLQYRQALSYDQAVAAQALGGGGDTRWNNGRVVTDAGAPCLPPGVAASVASGFLVGTAVTQPWGARAADDFLIRAPGGWDLSEIEFIAYVPGASQGFSPVSGVNVRIWSGKPGEPGSFVVFGDEWSNRLIVSDFAGAYRVPNAILPCQGDLPLFTVRASTPVHLPPGAYWVDVQMDTWMPSGIFMPPVTIPTLGAAPAGNAIVQFGFGSPWSVLQEPGPEFHELPILIRGAIVGGTEPCYANCDGSTITPVLNVNDFACFLNAFSAGLVVPPPQQIGHRANCDGSTTIPVLNVNDFACFLNAYAAGCTLP